MNATLYVYFAMTAAMLTCSYLVGMLSGEVLARRDARRKLHRRQVLAGLHAVDSARGRHPAGRAA